MFKRDLFAQLSISLSSKTAGAGILQLPSPVGYQLHISLELEPPDLLRWTYHRLHEHDIRPISGSAHEVCPIWNNDEKRREQACYVGGQSGVSRIGKAPGHSGNCCWHQHSDLKEHVIDILLAVIHQLAVIKFFSIHVEPGDALSSRPVSHSASLQKWAQVPQNDALFVSKISRHCYTIQGRQCMCPMPELITKIGSCNLTHWFRSLAGRV